MIPAVRTLIRPVPTMIPAHADVDSAYADDDPGRADDDSGHVDANLARADVVREVEGFVDARRSKSAPVPSRCCEASGKRPSRSRGPQEASGRSVVQCAELLGEYRHATFSCRCVVIDR